MTETIGKRKPPIPISLRKRIHNRVGATAQKGLSLFPHLISEARNSIEHITDDGSTRIAS